MAYRPTTLPDSASQKGVALVFVLLLLVLLSIMAGSFSQGIRSDASVVHQTKTRIQSNAIRDAGLAYAQYMLTAPPPALRWRVDARSYPFEFDGHHLTIEIQDEAGKFNLNTMDQDVLLVLLSPFAEDAELLAKNIIDWRNSDNEQGQGAAELEHHNGRSSNQTNRRFTSIKELLLVDGVTEKLYQKLAPLITVRSGQKLVDISVAAEAVLSLLPGGDPSWVQEVLTARDNAPLQSSLSIPAAMTKYAGFKTPRLGQYFNLNVWLTQSDGVRLATSVILQRNARKAFPVFKELERNTRYD